MGPTCRALLPCILVSTLSCAAGDAPDPPPAASKVGTGPHGTYQLSPIPPRSVWDYHDDGVPGPGWQVGCTTEPCLVPASGPGPYGYGESYIATQIAPTRPITTYFRRDFVIDLPVRAMYLRVMHDDGFVAYVNGEEARRASMPNGAVTHETIAVGHEALERYAIFDISARIPDLEVGLNQLAFEVHQGSTTSSDLVFDAELIIWTDGPIDVTAQGGIARGAMWHFWDREEIAGGWAELSHDDSGWSAAPGPLGFGEPYVASIVRTDPITTYFRKQVIIEGGVTSLRAHVMYDDGFIAYVNGTEVARRAMPSGAVTESTLAFGHEAGNSYETIDLDHAIGLLQDGENVVAIEVHQGGTMSSDLVFDLELEVIRGWTTQDLGESATLRDVHFIDTQRGWVAGSGGALFRTDDGGASWTRQSTGTTQGLNRIAFADSQHGWLSMGSGDLLRTLDGGDSWSVIDLPFRSTSGMAPIDAGTGWTVAHVVDFDYGLYRTLDGGVTWTLELALPGPGRVLFASALRGWMIYFPHLDGRTFIARTDDGGVTWTDVWMGDGMTKQLGLEVVGDDTLWLVGGESTGDLSGEWKMVTRDAGATFTVLPPTSNDVLLHDVDFADALHGWAVGAGDSLIHSDDGGHTWRVQLEDNCDDTPPVNCPTSLMAVSAASTTHVWAASFDGRVLHTSTGGE